MEDAALRIEHGQVPRVLLLGNGINRAHEFDSWDDLIETIRTKDLTEEEKVYMEKVPYPLRPVILTNDSLGRQMKMVSQSLAELCPPQEEKTTLQKFASLPFNSILTANYTYELEKTLDPDFSCLPGRRCKARRIAYKERGRYETQQLSTYYLCGNNIQPIWHIHGEAARSDTMILGHYYYGKLLAKMQQYVASFIRRYKGNYARQQSIGVQSWIDYFMIGEVHIVGLGMSLSEMDLWWLVNCKKLHFPDSKVILYKPDIKQEERLLSEAYGVVVEQGRFDGDFKAYYNWLYTELEKNL